MDLGILLKQLRAVLPGSAVITDPLELRTYECDGLAMYKVTPGIVVLPETEEQVAAIVRACARAGVPRRGEGLGDRVVPGARCLRRTGY